MSIVVQAKDFAEAKHAGKVRKYTDTPYSEHLAAVVASLEEHRIIMPSVLAAAWLQDTVENTDTTIVEVADAFGEECTREVHLSHLAKARLSTAWFSRDNHSAFALLFDRTAAAHVQAAARARRA